LRVGLVKSYNEMLIQFPEAEIQPTHS